MLIAIRLFNSHACGLLHNLLTLLVDEFVDLLTEVEAAQRALSLDLKPVLAALLVEVMLHVTLKDYDMVFIWNEVN